jgi:hypothetical protein
MGVPFLPHRTVTDAAEDLIRAVEALQLQRKQADRAVAALEARWAANRAHASRSERS